MTFTTSDSADPGQVIDIRSCVGTTAEPAPSPPPPSTPGSRPSSSSLVLVPVAIVLALTVAARRPERETVKNLHLWCYLAGSLCFLAGTIISLIRS